HRPQRLHRPGRRRSPPLHDARQRPDGHPRRVVGRALGRRPRRSEAQGSKVEYRAVIIPFFFPEERSMRLRNVWVGTMVVVLAASVAACGGSQETSSKSAEPSAPSGTPAGQKVDKSVAGSVKGAVVLDGVAPKNEP